MYNKVSLSGGLALSVLRRIGLYLWALTTTDSSQLARGLIWGDSDFDDWKRFPSRPVLADSNPVVIVLHRDNLLYEGYFNGSSREASQTSFSMAKSFASTLVGIAIDEGFIRSLDDPVTAYIPELLEKDKRFGDITIRHLITMSSGIRYRRYFSPWNDAATTYYAPDLRAAALNAKIDEPPGTRFLYNNYNPLLIGIVLERATGMSVSKYLETRLWQPMGAEADGSWSLDSKRSGFEKMESGINGRAIDFAKLGWLFLNGGFIGEHQVVSPSWVEEATRVDTTTDPAADYQYGWHVDVERNSYYAEGHFCQFVYVRPSAELVLVRTGRDCGGVYWTGFLGDMAQTLERQLAE
jgi:CubicO group peptidase (beta-lactamase class C family)